MAGTNELNLNRSKPSRSQLVETLLKTDTDLLCALFGSTRPWQVRFKVADSALSIEDHVQARLHSNRTLPHCRIYIFQVANMFWSQNRAVSCACEPFVRDCAGHFQCRRSDCDHIIMRGWLISNIEFLEKKAARTQKMLHLKAHWSWCAASKLLLSRSSASGMLIASGAILPWKLWILRETGARRALKLT